LLRLVRTAAEPGLQNMPMIVVTGADNDETARRKALDSGATDFITKPFTSIDILARARAHAAYQRITRELRTHVTIDPLTGLANKAAFLDRLQQDISYARRHQQELTLVRVEIDEMHSIFLKRGKEEAQHLIRHIAQLLRSRIRKEDTAARIGLGGFALSFPAGNVIGMQGMLDRLHSEVIEQPPEIDGRIVPITFTSTVMGIDMQLGPSAQEALDECERQLASASRKEIAQAAAAKVEAPQVAAPVADIVTMPAAVEAVLVDPLLDEVRKGNTRAAIEKMPRIVSRLVPLFRLMGPNQRAQLIKLLQSL